MEVNGDNCGARLCSVSKGNAVWPINLKNFLVTGKEQPNQYGREDYSPTNSVIIGDEVANLDCYCEHDSCGKKWLNICWTVAYSEESYFTKIGISLL